MTCTDTCLLPSNKSAFHAFELRSRDAAARFLLLRLSSFAEAHQPQHHARPAFTSTLPSLSGCHLPLKMCSLQFKRCHWYARFDVQ